MGSDDQGCPRDPGLTSSTASFLSAPRDPSADLTSAVQDQVRLGVDSIPVGRSGRLNSNWLAGAGVLVSPSLSVSGPPGTHPIILVPSSYSPSLGSLSAPSWECL